jgi:hypothetical protein
MRFLAYGGTAYSERRRIGDWRELPEEGTLSGLYGLRGGKIVYGVGLIDNLPTLIMKRLTAWNTRSYSYTILLDPGENVWKKFEWNFAGLFFSILKEPLLRNLFDKPEAVNEREVIQILGNLEPPTIIIGENNGVRENIRNLFTYFAVKGETFSFSPDKYGLMPVPNLKEMISILNQIPPPLRIGYGWLLNGNAINAEEFKAKFVLDDDEATLSKSIDKTELAEYIADGKKYREAWNMIWSRKTEENASQSNEIGELQNLSETPIHLWQAKLKFSCEILFSRIGLLAEINKYLLEMLHPEDEAGLFYQISQVEKQLEPLGNDIIKAVKNVAKREEQTFGDVGTKYFINRHFNRDYINKTLIERLHQDTVIDELLNRETTPTDAKLTVNAELRVLFWQKKFSREIQKGNIQKIPSYLKMALNDLAVNLVDENQLELLFNEAVRLSIKETPLNEWVKIAQEFKFELSPEILNWFATESLIRLIDENLPPQNSSIVEDYLHFINDEAGKLLSARMPDVERLDKIIKEAVRLAKGNEAISDKAKIWLAGIATSDLRKNIKIETKCQLVLAVTNAGMWSNLRILLILVGGSITGPLTNFKADELQILSQELYEYVSYVSEKEVLKPPNLVRLIEVFGTTPVMSKNNIGEKTIEILKKMNPILTLPDIRTWVIGWDTLDEKEFADRERIRILFANHKEYYYKEVCKALSLNRFCNESLKNLCQTLLIKDSLLRNPFENKHRVNVFFEYCRKTTNEELKRWYLEIGEALDNPSQEEKTIIYERFTAHQIYYSNWCEVLPDEFQQRFLEIFYETNKDGRFLDFAENVQKALGNNKAWFAIVEFLKDRQDTPTFKALIRDLKLNWKTELARVEKLVEKAKTENKTSQQPANSSKIKVNHKKNTEAPKGAWGTTVKKFIGF